MSQDMIQADDHTKQRDAFNAMCEAIQEGIDVARRGYMAQFPDHLPVVNFTVNIKQRKQKKQSTANGGLFEATP